MTEYERVKQAIIDIIAGDHRSKYVKNCPHNSYGIHRCPECVADAILAIPGLFVEDKESRLEVEIVDNDGYDDTWDITTQARAQGWKKAEGK